MKLFDIGFSSLADPRISKPEAIARASRDGCLRGGFGISQ